MSQANSINTTSLPVDLSRRRFMAAAAAASAVSAGALAVAAMPPVAAVGIPAACLTTDPIFAVIERHRAEQQAYEAAITDQGKLEETLPDEVRRSPRVQFGLRDGVNPYYLYSHEQIEHRLE